MRIRLVLILQSEIIETMDKFIFYLCNEFELEIPTFRTSNSRRHKIDSVFLDNKQNEEKHARDNDENNECDTIQRLSEQFPKCISQWISIQKRFAHTCFAWTFFDFTPAAGVNACKFQQIVSQDNHRRDDERRR